MNGSGMAPQRALDGAHGKARDTLPKGIGLLKAEMDKPPNLRKLQDIARARLAAKGARDVVTSRMYELIVNAQGWLSKDGWGFFLAQYDAVNAALDAKPSP